MDEAAKRFADLAAQYAPNVIDAAKQAARIEAYSALALSVIWFGFAVSLAVAARICLRTHPEWDDDWFIPARFVGWVAICISALCFAGGLWAWINPWTWVTMTSPELWIAKRALHL